MNLKRLCSMFLLTFALAALPIDCDDLPLPTPITSPA